MAHRALYFLFRSTKRHGINKLLLITANSGLTPPGTNAVLGWGKGEGRGYASKSLRAENGVAAPTNPVFPERQD